MWLFYSMSNSVSLRQGLVHESPGQNIRTTVAAAARAEASPTTSIAVAIGPVVPYICNVQSVYQHIRGLVGPLHHLCVRFTNWLPAMFNRNYQHICGRVRLARHLCVRFTSWMSGYYPCPWLRASMYASVASCALTVWIRCPEVRKGLYTVVLPLPLELLPPRFCFSCCWEFSRFTLDCRLAPVATCLAFQVRFLLYSSCVILDMAPLAIPCPLNAPLNIPLPLDAFCCVAAPLPNGLYPPLCCHCLVGCPCRQVALAGPSLPLWDWVVLPPHGWFWPLDAHACSEWNPALHLRQRVFVINLYFMHCFDPCPCFPHLKHPSPTICFASVIHAILSSLACFAWFGVVWIFLMWLPRPLSGLPLPLGWPLPLLGISSIFGLCGSPLPLLLICLSPLILPLPRPFP